MFVWIQRGLHLLWPRVFFPPTKTPWKKRHPRQNAVCWFHFSAQCSLLRQNDWITRRPDAGLVAPRPFLCRTSAAGSWMKPRKTLAQRKQQGAFCCELEIFSTSSRLPRLPLLLDLHRRAPQSKPGADCTGNMNVYASAWIEIKSDSGLLCMWR